VYRALAFARRGDNVVLVARGAERLAAAAEQCRALGGRVVAAAVRRTARRGRVRADTARGR
jgi:short-subunit dehydrogenase